MMRLAGIYTLIVILSILLFPPGVLADSSTNVNISNNGSNSQTHVNVSTNTGGNTICQNGNCTTTSNGDGSATVCINGNCQTSTSGNINVQAQNGNDQVTVSNSGTPVPTISMQPSQVSVSPGPSVSIQPTLTPNPTVTQMRNAINKHVEKEIAIIKKHVKEQNSAISAFIESEMQNLQNLLNGIFK